MKELTWSSLDILCLLPQVREAWQTYELEMINYQNKCRIIRGWDDLFTKCKEHLNSVAAMKLSPYYKVLVVLYTHDPNGELRIHV